MKISIRKFESKDIPKKVEWINNSENNKYLHYDIPLKIEKTEKNHSIIAGTDSGVSYDFLHKKAGRTAHS